MKRTILFALMIPLLLTGCEPQRDALHTGRCA